MEASQQDRLYSNPLNQGRYRNNPCPCGSGKKIKKCHGRATAVSFDERNDIIRLVNEFNVRFKTQFEDAASKALEASKALKELADGNKESRDN